MSALFSNCGRYRYKLTRMLGDGPTVTLVMVNPSNADGTKDDPTIRRVMGFGRALGWGQLIVVNKFAWITPNIRDLDAIEDPIGPSNDGHIIGSVKEADLTVVAWGNLGKLRSAKLRARVSVVSQLLDAHGKKVFCWGLTKDGQPKHPLFLTREAVLVPWRLDK